MVRLAALLAALAITACGAAATTTVAPAPTSGATVNDRPAGPDGAPPGAKPPPHFCGDQLCASPSPH